MVKNTFIRRTVLALGAAVTLFAAMPSEAYDRYDHSPSYRGSSWHDDGRHDRRDDDRRYDHRERYDQRHGGWHDRYDRRDDWRYRHDGGYRHEWDRRWH